MVILKKGMNTGVKTARRRRWEGYFPEVDDSPDQFQLSPYLEAVQIAENVWIVLIVQ